MIIAFLAPSPSPAQQPTEKHTPGPVTPQLSTTAWSDDLKKYPGLLTELGQVVSKMQQSVAPPLPRTESRLLPLLPDSTVIYASAPNYGDTAQQTLTVWREALKQSDVLRDWWAHGQSVASVAPKLEETLDKVAQFYQYLGDETAFCVTSDSQDHDKLRFALVAEIRKPGLDSTLREWLASFKGTGTPIAQVFSPKQLAAAPDYPKSQDPLIVLIRPDLLVITFDLAAARSFDAYLTSAKRDFASSPFGRRVAEAYSGGATMLAAADLQPLLRQIPNPTKENQESLARSGFGDVQYLVWKHGPVAGQSVSQGELSFSAPRHGAAAWLDKPAPLGSLDFISPKAPFALALKLTTLAKIFDDTQLIAGPKNAGAFAAVGAGEKALNLSLKEDLLNQLTGEIAFELDKVSGVNGVNESEPRSCSIRRASRRGRPY